MQGELEILLDAELRNAVTQPSKMSISDFGELSVFPVSNFVGEQEEGIILRVRLAHAVQAKIQRICAFENSTCKIR